MTQNTATPIVLATTVPAEADEVFTAITTTEGQRSFWTVDCEVGPESARFGFPYVPVGVRVEVQSEPGKLVRWSVLGDFPGWEGSTIEWELGPAMGEDEQGTTVVLRHVGLHGDFAAVDAALGNVAHTWAMILDRLSSYLESGEADPYFPAEA